MDALFKVFLVERMVQEVDLLRRSIAMDVSSLRVEAIMGLFVFRVLVLKDCLKIAIVASATVVLRRGVLVLHVQV
jgi:hypothetical protein